MEAPSVWSSDWRCPVHGVVLPMQPPYAPSNEGLAAVLQRTKVPVWAVWPLLPSWLVTGFVQVGDEHTGGRACGVALSGPALSGGPADMLVIAEEPGIGLGCHFAGVDGPDPGEVGRDSAPHAKASMLGHPVPLWSVEAAPDRAAYVGEALGNWLWIVLWPAETGALMLDGPELCDLREPGMEIDLPYGAFCPRLEF